MKHACSVCNKFFQNRDAVIKISHATISNSNAAYVRLDECFDDEDIIHSDCLVNYADGVETVVEIERPKVANPISEPVRNDKIQNSVTALKGFGVSDVDATKGVEKMLGENPGLTTQEILCGFPYGV